MARRTKFSLLLLEEGEYLLEEYAAVLLTAPANAAAAADSSADPFLLESRIRGRLRLCTRSLFFESDDTRHPILKFPYSSMPGKPALLTAWPFAAACTSVSRGLGAEALAPRDAMVMQISSQTEMRPGSVIGPYRTRAFGDPGAGGAGAAAAGAAAAAAGAHVLGRQTVILALLYMQAAQVLPLLAQAWSIQQRAAAPGGGAALERSLVETQLLTPRRDGPFNLSLLSDFRERPLLPAAPAALVVERVFPLVTCPGRLMLTERALYVQPIAVNSVAGCDPVTAIPLRDVRRVLRRRRLQRETGLEVFLHESAAASAAAAEAAAAGLRGSAVSASGGATALPTGLAGAGPSYFFGFSSPDERNRVYRELLALLRERRARNRRIGLGNGGLGVGGASGGAGAASAGSGSGGAGSGVAASGMFGSASSGDYDDELGDPFPDSISLVTRAWQARRLSNLDYLAYLNTVAGRSLADLTQFPVFPWVVADYSSPVLDLDNPATFRDLGKPLGALNPTRIERLRERFKEMPRGAGAEPPFLYGTHYSTPGYCLYFLVRAMPEHMLRLQSGRFDAPDRLFFDIASAWSGVTSLNMDVKELTPHFYAGDGAFLTAPEGLDLGVRQNGRRVGDVTLPPWALDAGDFVAKLREALECDYVSERLHGWIDLIFGFKQRGPAAEAADNVYYYLTYEGAVDVEGIADPDRRHAMQQQIAEFGQTPRQLFRSPHPNRTGPMLPAPVTGGTAAALAAAGAGRTFSGSGSFSGGVGRTGGRSSDADAAADGSGPGSGRPASASGSTHGHGHGHGPRGSHSGGHGAGARGTRRSTVRSSAAAARASSLASWGSGSMGGGMGDGMGDGMGNGMGGASTFLQHCNDIEADGAAGVGFGLGDGDDDAPGAAGTAFGPLVGFGAGGTGGGRASTAAGTGTGGNVRMSMSVAVGMGLGLGAGMGLGVGAGGGFGGAGAALLAHMMMDDEEWSEVAWSAVHVSDPRAGSNASAIAGAAGATPSPASAGDKSKADGENEDGDRDGDGERDGDSDGPPPPPPSSSVSSCLVRVCGGAVAGVAGFPCLSLAGGAGIGHEAARARGLLLLAAGTDGACVLRRFGFSESEAALTDLLAYDAAALPLPLPVLAATASGDAVQPPEQLALVPAKLPLGPGADPEAAAAGTMPGAPANVKLAQLAPYQLMHRALHGDTAPFPITCVDSALGGRVIFAGSADGAVYVIDAAAPLGQHACLRRLKLAAGAAVSCLRVTTLQRLEIRQKNGMVAPADVAAADAITGLDEEVEGEGEAEGGSGKAAKAAVSGGPVVVPAGAGKAVRSWLLAVSAGSWDCSVSMQTLVLTEYDAQPSSSGKGVGSTVLAVDADAAPDLRVREHTAPVTALAAWRARPRKGDGSPGVHLVSGDASGRVVWFAAFLAPAVSAATAPTAPGSGTGAASATSSPSPVPVSDKPGRRASEATPRGLGLLGSLGLTSVAEADGGEDGSSAAAASDGTDAADTASGATSGSRAAPAAPPPWMPLGAGAGPVALTPPLVSSLILDCEVLGTSDDLVPGCASARTDVTAGGVSGVTNLTWSTPLLLPVKSTAEATGVASAVDGAAGTTDPTSMSSSVGAGTGGSGVGAGRSKPSSTLQAQALCYATTADGRIAVFKANGRSTAPSAGASKASSGASSSVPGAPLAGGAAAASGLTMLPSSLHLHAVISSGEVLRCLAVSHDGCCLATGGNGGKVRLWGTAALLEKGADGPPPGYEALSMEEALAADGDKDKDSKDKDGKEKERDAASDMLAARRQALKPVSVRLAAEAVRSIHGQDGSVNATGADGAAASLRDPCQPYWAKFPSGQPVLCATAADCLVATLTVGDDTVVYRSGTLAALAGGGDAGEGDGAADGEGEDDLDAAFAGLDGLGLSGSRRSARLPSALGSRGSMIPGASGAGRPRASMRLSFAAGAGGAGVLRAVPEGGGAGAASGAAAKPAAAHDPAAAAASVSEFWGSPSRWVTALCFRRLHARMRTDIGVGSAARADAKARAARAAGSSEASKEGSADADAEAEAEAAAEAEAEAEVDAELSLGQQYLLVAGTQSGEAAMWVGKRHEPEDEDEEDPDDDGRRRSSNSFSLSQSRSRSRSHLDRRASRGSAAFGSGGVRSRLSEDGLDEAGDMPAGRRRLAPEQDGKGEGEGAADSATGESEAGAGAGADMLAQAGLEDALAPAGSSE